MITPSRQLLLRIYAVSLAQLLAIVATIALVAWLTFKPSPRGGFINEAQYVVANLAELIDDRAALEAEIARAARLTGCKVSLYRDGRLIASSVSPPLTDVPEKRRALLTGATPVLPLEPFPLVALLLDPQKPTLGYAVFRPGPMPKPGLSKALWAAGIAIVLSGVAAMMLARSIVKPLSQLTALAQKLGRGELNARARDKRSDEFGQLSRAFDDMADRLTLVLRSQQELLANVSHELRTPLARIRVALDLAAEGDADTAREALSEITADLQELERLVADVLQTAKLDLSTGRAGQGLPILRREVVDIAELIARAVERFRHAHPSRHLLVLAMGTLPPIAGDAVLLRRALDNLLSNASAYSDLDTSIDLRTERRGELLVISVIDRGIGIAAADLPRIGTPFFRTDPSRARRTGGLGLGLSLARRIVEAHGGRLTIESQLGHGTTIHLELPVHESLTA